MPFQEFANCFLFSCPSVLVALAKELVVFGAPNSAAKSRLSRGMLELADATPELGTLQAMLMFENPLDCRVGASTALPSAVPEDLVHLFWSEESERFPAPRIVLTVRHGNRPL